MCEKIVASTVTVNNEQGLHLRPADLFVRRANEFECAVALEKDGNRVDGKSILEIVTLGAECGSQVRITTHGPDAEEAMEALVELVERGFAPEEEEIVDQQ